MKRNDIYWGWIAVLIAVILGALIYAASTIESTSCAGLTVEQCWEKV